MGLKLECVHVEFLCVGENSVFYIQNNFYPNGTHEETSCLGRNVF